MESSRKRKRPTYLQDFYDPSLIVEEPVLKKTIEQKDELKENLEDFEETVVEKPVLEEPLSSEYTQQQKINLSSKQVELKVESKPYLESFEEPVFQNTVDLKIDAKQYLHDFDDSSLIVKEPEVEKKVDLIVEPIQVPKQYCSLCGKFTEASSIVWDMATPTGASSSTFSAVLEKVITEEQLVQMAKNLDFLRGFLCLVCKDYVIALDRLQREVVEVKKSIVWLFKNNEHIEKKNMAEQEKAEAIYQTMVGKWKKVGDLNELAANNKSDMPQIQQGNTAKETLPDKTMHDEKIELPKNKNPNDKKEKEKVESLLEKRGYKYLVKWKNCSEALNSWEARFALPQLIVKYYEADISRLGTAAPDNLEEVDDESDSDEDDSETDESESEEEEEGELKSVQNIQKPEKLIEQKNMLNIQGIDISVSRKTETPISEVNLHYMPEGLKFPSLTIFKQKSQEEDIQKSTLNVFKTSNDTKETMKIEKPDTKSLKAKKDKIGFDCWITKPKQNVGKTKPMIETTNPSNDKRKEDKTNGSKDNSNEQQKQNIHSDTNVLSHVKTPSIDSQQSSSIVKTLKPKVDENSEKKGIKESKQEKAGVNIPSKPAIVKTKSPVVKARNGKTPSEDPTITELKQVVALDGTPSKPKRVRKKKKLLTEEEDEEFIIKANKELKPVVASEDIPIKPKRARKKKIVIEEDDEEEFIVEALLEKKGTKFLVKWETYTEAFNSWEPKSGLPEFIVKYYEEDLSRLGTPAPSGSEEEVDGSKEKDQTDADKILKT